jgi:hypothetical protein
MADASPHLWFDGHTSLKALLVLGNVFFNFRFIPPCLRSYINAIVYAKKTCSLYLIIWDTVYPLWILKHPLKVKKTCFSRHVAAQHFLLDFQDAFNLGKGSHN